MSTTFHIRIKKDYAFALIEDLQKVEAIEVIEEESYDCFEIQDW